MTRVGEQTCKEGDVVAVQIEVPQLCQSTEVAKSSQPVVAEV